MRSTHLVALFASFALFGCSSEGDGPTPVVPGNEAKELEAPAPGTGVQFKMLSTIEPGNETERCQFVVAPPEGLNVNNSEVRYNGGSHHVLLYMTPYTEIPTENRSGEKVDTSGVMECPEGATADWRASGVIGGSQSFEGENLLNQLPEGVAVKIKPGAVLLMNVHYLNASAKPLDTDVRINLYSIPEEEVKEEAGILFYYNPFIQVPASGTASARMRCPVDTDISLVNVQSHMHRRGMGAVAYLTDGAGNEIQQIYSSTTWENVPVEKFEPALQIKAGQALDYRCDYSNPEARDIVQGATTKDEMCMLIGPYYPRNPSLENCEGGDGVPNATWIGDGSANGAATLQCIGKAKPFNEDNGNSLFGCVVNSCAGISEPMSEFFRCRFFGGGATECPTECQTSEEACDACLAKVCEPTQSAFVAATCD